MPSQQQDKSFDHDEVTASQTTTSDPQDRAPRPLDQLQAGYSEAQWEASLQDDIVSRIITVTQSSAGTEDGEVSQEGSREANSRAYPVILIETTDEEARLVPRKPDGTFDVETFLGRLHADQSSDNAVPTFRGRYTVRCGDESEALEVETALTKRGIPFEHIGNRAVLGMTFRGEPPRGSRGVVVRRPRSQTRRTSPSRASSRKNKTAQHGLETSDHSRRVFFAVEHAIADIQK